MQKALKKAMGNERLVDLDNGDKIRISKWSVRKAMVMGATIAKVIGHVVGLLDAKSDDGSIQIGDDVSMIPQVMDHCADELTYIVIESTTLEDHTKQLTKDQLLDDLTLDDFIELLSVIMEVNFTEATVGKWKRLLKATPIMGA